MRQLADTAQGAANTATATAGQYGGAAGGIAGTLVPGLERQFNAPPGMSSADLAMQQTQQQEAAGGTAGGLKGSLALRAARMGNPAGVSADAAAISQGASRAQGQGVQDVMTQNALLKQKQQQDAAQGLAGIYGTDVRAQGESAGQVAPDVKAGVDASQTGWLQNLQGILGTLGTLGMGSAKLAGMGK